MTKSGLDQAGQDDIPALWKENKWIGTFRSSNKPCKTRFLTLSQFQPYHLSNPSPWPLLSSFGAISLVVSFATFFSLIGAPSLLLLSSFTLALVLYQWWRDVCREGSVQGFHTARVQSGLQWGIALFILSEVMLFFSLFWGYFHFSLSTRVPVGQAWPPVGLVSFNAFELPLLNTLILLGSGVTITVAHHGLCVQEHGWVLKRLVITICLGLYFTALQGLEYSVRRFSLMDRRYGSVFFISTGTHGLHVLLGSCFILVRVARLIKGQFSSSHHFGFEASAWYWHFVDVVWLLLFSVFYWWGA